MTTIDALVSTVEQDGIAVIPGYVTGSRLAAMRQTFSAALARLRINNIDGYEKTERLRDMIEHPLLLDQGFLELGIDPMVTEVVRRYVGPQFQLNECKGWRSRPTMKDWHGWHGDSWYDQEVVRDSIPRELKLGLYLTDVSSGGLSYVRGSHRKQLPTLHPRGPAEQAFEERSLKVNGPAGTVMLFDTSGVHRQSAPILHTRHALFYCYHDPAVPLQAEDIAYNRYHPLHLNAAFLGGLNSEQQRILGFGDRRQFVPGYRRKAGFALAHATYSALLEASLWVDEVTEPLTRRMRALRSKIFSE